MASNMQSASRPRIIWALIISVALLLTGLLTWNSFRAASSMSAAAAPSERPLSRTAAGEKTKVVMEITQANPDGLLRGKILEKQTEKIYIRTDTNVAVQSSERTKMVMGKSDDLHPAAVIHVTGAVREDRVIDAEQIVILTGYVEVH